MKTALPIITAILFMVTGVISCNDKQNNDETVPEASTENTTETVEKVDPPSEKVDKPVEPVEKKPEVKPPVKVITKDIDIKGSMLEVDKKTGMYKYCTNCRRRSSVYEYYYFNKAEYEKIVGAANLKNRVTIKVQILGKNATSYSPKNPKLAQPTGGFTHNHYTCKIIKLIQSK
jgi:hypothetical protein